MTLVAPHAEHRPGHAWREARIELDQGFARKDRRRRKTPGPVVSGSAGAAPRPVWLLAEPEPSVDFPGHRFEAQPWVLRGGPERIESGWWDGADVRRDYFVAGHPRGETVWIYRDHRCGIDDGEWFMHGVFA